ncbi:hypothetical protein HOY80DRAFT_956222, partial [Tuber brumale]
MAIRLPSKKLKKARDIITGYLNFVAVVVPLGRTFLRRLYNMELYFPQEGRNRRRWISQEARKDLKWWSELLARCPERSIRTRARNRVSV